MIQRKKPEGLTVRVFRVASHADRKSAVLFVSCLPSSFSQYPPLPLPMVVFQDCHTIWECYKTADTLIYTALTPNLCEQIFWSNLNFVDWSNTRTNAGTARHTNKRTLGTARTRHARTNTHTHTHTHTHARTDADTAANKITADGNG